MGALTKKLRNFDGGISHWCPGCDGIHGIHTTKPNDRGAQWSFDGNIDAPTFSPSIHIWTEQDREGNPLPAGQRRTICHYFINAGQIQFCGDSDHALAGQTVPIPEGPTGLRTSHRGRGCGDTTERQ